MRSPVWSAKSNSPWRARTCASPQRRQKGRTSRSWSRRSTLSRTAPICCAPRSRQRMEGNLVANLREHFDHIGHVQIADSPERGEPGTGEIHYPYLLGELEDLGYEGYVGLEYNPTTESTEESFGWLPKELRGKDVAVSDLEF